MLFELRIYRTRPGQRAAWVKFFEEEIVPYLHAKGIVPVGSFVSEQDEDQFVWMRRFDSEEERVRLYEAFYESEHWKANLSPRVGELIDRHRPDTAVLEESFVGADARTALSVGQARGAVLVACATAGLPCAEYAPAHVKQAVCGYGRADKQQVQRMIKAILGLESLPRPHHAADALAVAVCHALAPPLARMAG